MNGRPDWDADKVKIWMGDRIEMQHMGIWRKDKVKIWRKYKVKIWVWETGLRKRWSEDLNGRQDWDATYGNRDLVVQFVSSQYHNNLSSPDISRPTRVGRGNNDHNP